ncbi:MAG TPA: RecX family transcriptional regulator [Coxiellaceae bacterium]|nr:RecX family transcriptional regulator [Coxiellaceae bacterium]
MLPKIRRSALDILARREHSKFELQHKLSLKGFAVGDIVKITQDLISQGLQSDARFVESYVSMRRNRGFGPVRIKAELHERGIDSTLGEQFLDEHNPIWFELATVMRCKKFGEKKPDGLREQAKQMRYLYYKGFTADQIKRAFIYEKMGNF